MKVVTIKNKCPLESTYYEAEIFNFASLMDSWGREGCRGDGGAGKNPLLCTFGRGGV